MFYDICSFYQQVELLVQVRAALEYAPARGVPRVCNELDDIPSGAARATDIASNCFQLMHVESDQSTHRLPRHSLQHIDEFRSSSLNNGRLSRVITYGPLTDPKEISSGVYL